MEEAHRPSWHFLNLLEPKIMSISRKGTLSNAHTLWTDDEKCTLRLFYYPPNGCLDLKRIVCLWLRKLRIGTIIPFYFNGQDKSCSNLHDSTKVSKGQTPVDLVSSLLSINMKDILAWWSIVLGVCIQIFVDFECLYSKNIYTMHLLDFPYFIANFYHQYRYSNIKHRDYTKSKDLKIYSEFASSIF